MAFSATTEFDVRTGGSDSNAGGFDTASTGTDRSQSNAAFQAYTDLVIGGTNTTITSAAHPFDSTSPGNIINITGGTGFTVQRVQIVSVAGAVATCDKAVGTAASTGGTGNLGGSLLTLATAAGLVVAGNTVHVKAGTYTLTASVTVQALNQVWQGYQTTHRDGGTKPLITTATNSTPLFLFPGTGVVGWFNLSHSNTATTRAPGLQSTGSFPSVIVSDCVFDGISYGIDGISGGGNFASISVTATQFKNYTLNGIYANFRCGVQGCFFTGGTSSSGWGVFAAAGVTVSRCIFASSTGSGVNFASGQTASVFSCSFYGLGQNGIFGGGNGEAILTNNIFYQITGDAINNNSGAMTGIQTNNAFGANGLNRDGLARYALRDITLTANPFTNAGSGDFSLNSTAGGGLLCKGTGYPGAFAGGTSTGVLDVGAVQGSSGGGGAALACNPLGGFVA